MTFIAFGLTHHFPISTFFILIRAHVFLIALCRPDCYRENCALASALCLARKTDFVKLVLGYPEV